MTICVSVKTRDGVVLGTDSMSTVTVGSVEESFDTKTYRNARKLFQVRQLPIGIFTYGLASIGNRTVASLIHEYLAGDAEDTVGGVATGLARYVFEIYQEFISTIGSESYDLGIFVAGYSPGERYAEEWEARLPIVAEPKPVRHADNFGVQWRGIERPFARLYHGFDPRIFEILGDNIDEETRNRWDRFLRSHLETANSIESMPLQDALNYAVYVLNTTIGFSGFESGPPPCGGPLQVMVISSTDGLRWVHRPQLIIQESSNDWT